MLSTTPDSDFLCSPTRFNNPHGEQERKKVAHFGSDGLVTLEDMLKRSFRFRKGGGKGPKMIFGLVVQQNNDVTFHMTLTDWLNLI